MRPARPLCPARECVRWSHAPISDSIVKLPATRVRFSQRSATPILGGAGYAVGFFLPPGIEGDGAPSDATCHFSSRIVSDAWRLSARHRGVFLPAPGRALPTNRFALPPSRPLRRLSGQPLLPKLKADRGGPPSASSWQGAVVPPGGAPAPPGRGRYVRLPRAGAASCSIIKTSLDDALCRAERAQHKPARSDGDKFSRKCDYDPNSKKAPII